MLILDCILDTEFFVVVVIKDSSGTKGCRISNSIIPVFPCYLHCDYIRERRHF